MADLERFVAAQGGGVWPTALAELTAGAKRSHWMWFIFPQLAGLGRSEMARFYAIRDLPEARAYLAHPLLVQRLCKGTATVLQWAGRRSAEAIFGAVDAAKFRSSMTLFATASADPAPFAAALDAFFAGERDPATLARL